MATRPHRVVDEGRAVLFEDGPLRYRDLGDTLAHVMAHHRRRPDVLFVSRDQRRSLMMDPDFLFRRYPDDPDNIHPDFVARIFGAEVRVRPDERHGVTRRPATAMHPTAYGQRPEPAQWITHTTTAAQTQDTIDAWKIQFGTNILKGAKFDAAWIDDMKPKAESTHENW